MSDATLYISIAVLAVAFILFIIGAIKATVQLNKRDAFKKKDLSPNATANTITIKGEQYREVIITGGLPKGKRLTPTHEGEIVKIGPNQFS
jgi:hypothetical protein